MSVCDGRVIVKGYNETTKRHLLWKPSCPDKDGFLLDVKVVPIQRGVHGGTHEDDLDVREAFQHPLGE